MLSGWTLMAEHCPVCSSPLLRKADVLKCAVCDRLVLREKDLNQNEKNKKFEPSTDEIISSGSEEKAWISSDECKRNYDLKNKEKNIVSAKLGQKMLSGWALLAEICPVILCNGTPLVSLKNERNMLCVSCEKEFKYSGLGELIPVTDEKTVTLEIETKKEPEKGVKDGIIDAPTFSSDLSYGAILNFQTDKNDPSEKISAKLREGWAILSASCDACNGRIPLLRNLSGDRICVVCSDTNSSQIINKDVPVPVPVPVHVPFPVHVPVLNNDSDIDDDEQLVYENYTKRRLIEAEREVRQSGSGARRGEGGLMETPMGAAETTLSVTMRSISATRQKLNLWTSDLEQATDVTTCSAIAAGIARLAEALVALEHLHKVVA